MAATHAGDSDKNVARPSQSMKLGWIALAVFAVGIALAFLMEEAGFVVIGIGTVLLAISLVKELRHRRQAQEAGSAFAEGGTFGGRRSPQTHEQM